MIRIYKFLLEIARNIGINRSKTARKIIDFLKEAMKNNKVPFVINIQGFKINGLTWIHYLLGTYESETTELFKKVIKSGHTVIDVGADYGYFSLLSAKLVGHKGKVFAFEPYVAQSKKYLRSNIALNHFKNITVIEKAVGDKDDTKKYFINSRSLFNVKHDMDVISNVNIDSVKSIKLDDFFKNYPHPIDFVKIDIEGGEIDALKGMKSIIKNNPDIKLVVEIAPIIMENIGLSPSSILLLLRTYGFSLYWINNDGSVTEMLNTEIILNARKAKHINIFCSKLK